MKLATNIRKKFSNRICVHRRSQSGFTLIEVLVAMIILSFVVSVGYGLINSSNSIVSKQTGLTDMRNDLRIALIQMTKDIQQSESVIGAGTTGAPYSFIQSSANAVSYSFNDSTNKVIRHDGAEQSTLIESVEAFTINLIHADEQFEINVTVNGEEHSILVTRRIKGNVGSIDYGSIAGVVRNQVNSHSIQNATVVAKDSNTGSEYWFVTDASGNYVINLPAGMYEVTASAIGYVHETRSLTVANGENKLNENFDLAPIALEQPKIISFIFEKSQNPTSIPLNYALSEIIGVINHDTKTITIEVPFGTNVATLKPTITVSDGATVSPNSGAVNNFTNPQTYRATDSIGNYTDYLVTVTVKNQSFAEYLQHENVFVYGTNLGLNYLANSGGSNKLRNDLDSNGTVVITNQNNANLVFRANHEIDMKKIFIDKSGKKVIFEDKASTKLGIAGVTELINIKGDVEINNGAAEIKGKDIYIDGNVIFNNSAKITGENVYITGNVDFKNWSAQIIANNIYIGGGIIWIQSGNIVGNLINPASIVVPPQPNLTIPSLKQDSWYEQNGYVSGGALQSNKKIFSQGNYYFSSHLVYTNVIIVSKGDIHLDGNIGVTGVLFAPYGSVTFNGSTDDRPFEGVILARDGFYTTNGNSRIMFRNINNYIQNITEYPFE
jgi:prepilin-type N-terminal cleavage/methylation domain-containing protein